MVYIHWRTTTNNLGKRFDHPPFLGNAQIYTFFLGVGLPLEAFEGNLVSYKSYKFFKSYKFYKSYKF